MWIRRIRNTGIFVDPLLATRDGSVFESLQVDHHLGEYERLAANAKVATIPGSIPESSDIVESEGGR
jgi:hypothetical protein